LAKAAGRGDREAQRRIVSSLMDRVRNTAVYLVGHGADADDMAQLALMEVLRSLPSYAGRGSLESWATRIAVRSIYAQLRRRAARRQHEQVAEDPQAHAEGADAEAPDEHELDAAVLRQRIMALLSELKEPKRVALVLKLVHGYTVEEIAEITGAPFETVRSRLRHARTEFAQKVQADPELGRYVKEVLG
jgi:RNA polymerase sigma-70 factor (ECF subfamily)